MGIGRKSSTRMVKSSNEPWQYRDHVQGKTDPGDGRLQEVTGSAIKDRAWPGFSSGRPTAYRITLWSDTTLDH